MKPLNRAQREALKELNALTEELKLLFSFYRWYLEEMEFDSETEEWTQVFHIRTNIQKLFLLPLPGLAVTARKEKEYIKLCRKLRELDLKLLKKRDFLKKEFDFESFRTEECQFRNWKEIPKKLWWYHLDSNKIPDFNVPIWLLVPETCKFKAVIVSGRLKEKPVKVLLYVPIETNLKKREKLEKDIVSNIDFDYPTFIYDEFRISGRVKKQHSFSAFVLPISGLIAKLHLTNKLYLEELKHKELLIAFPKETSVFRTRFYQELKEAIFKGNTKFLNEKTLKEEQFAFFKVDIVISRELEIELKKESGEKKLLPEKTSELSGDIVLQV